MTQVTSISNADIVEQFQAGKFIRQICRENHVSVLRVREAIDSAGIGRHGEAIV